MCQTGDDHRRFGVDEDRSACWESQHGQHDRDERGGVKPRKKKYLVQDLALAFDRVADQYERGRPGHTR